MGINFFILLIIIISLLFTNYNFEEKKEEIKYKNIPLITFNDSTMYDINEKKVNRIIVATQALKYKNRDELYNATIILRNKTNKTNSISAEYILSKNDIYKFYQNVNIEINNDSNITLISDYVEFNKNKNILKNNKIFNLQYNKNSLIGDNLYFDINNNIIKAKNTHFKLFTKENK